jgi:hypothetical protein
MPAATDVTQPPPGKSSHELEDNGRTVRALPGIGESVGVGGDLGRDPGEVDRRA